MAPGAMTGPPPPAMGRRRGGPRPSGQGLVVGGGRGRRVLMGLPRPGDGVLMMGI